MYTAYFFLEEEQEGRKEGRSHELGLGASVLAHFPAAALSRRKAEPKSTPLCI